MSNNTILIVDDEMLTRSMLRMLLELKGYVTMEAADGVEALQKVAERQPQGMILDVMMPNLDGIEVCKRLKGKAETAVIPIIVLSGGKYENEALAAGANMYMEKPMETHDLLTALADFTTR